MKINQAVQSILVKMRNRGLTPGEMLMALSVAKKTIKKDRQ